MSNYRSLELGEAVRNPHAYWRRLHADKCASSKNEYGEFLGYWDGKIGTKNITIDALMYEGAVIVIFMGKQYTLDPEEFEGIKNTDHSQTSTQDFINILKSFYEA